MLRETRTQDRNKSAMERRLAMGLEENNPDPDHEIDLEDIEPDNIEDIEFEEE